MLWLHRTTRRPVFAEARQVLASHSTDDLVVARPRKPFDTMYGSTFSECLYSLSCHIFRVLSNPNVVCVYCTKIESVQARYTPCDSTMFTSSLNVHLLDLLTSIRSFRCVQTRSALFTCRFSGNINVFPHCSVCSLSNNLISSSFMS
ncbi:hypothetical protein OESDEN_02432 [Oesophagostomum dentatum]|uniref:Uncharacterized protein n=1 Tax=Oesophagostomum dentatum TaxID=61180 RepID=A0A0B1TND1_OESDE|nr:hypothetical protein OESDEN_02432 [Oesophagostomum dentatum]